MISDTKLAKEMARMKVLKQFKDLSDEQLKEVAVAKIEEKELLEDINLNDQEKKAYLDLYKRYHEAYHFTAPSDKESLKQLCSLEIIHKRLTNLINQLSIETPKAIDCKQLESLMGIQKQILSMKDSLGLLKERKQESWLTFWLNLKKKLQLYFETHKGEFILKCPHCGEYFHTVLRLNDYDIQKLWCFRGTSLYNETLLRGIEEKSVITVDTVAEVFGSSTDFVNGMYQLYLNEKSRAKQQVTDAH
jgi:hypothetical protein